MDPKVLRALVSASLSPVSSVDPRPCVIEPFYDLTFFENGFDRKVWIFRESNDAKQLIWLTGSSAFRLPEPLIKLKPRVVHAVPKDELTSPIPKGTRYESMDRLMPYIFELGEVRTNIYAPRQFVLNGLQYVCCWAAFSRDEFNFYLIRLNTPHQELKRACENALHLISKSK